MRFSRLVLIGAAALTTACASDGSTSPAAPNGDTRLAAVATVVSDRLGDASGTVKLTVSVTSSLTEQVSTSRCASQVQARTSSSTTWTDVTSESMACSTIALLVLPGATVQITGTADAAKLRTVASAGTTVVLRVRHTLDGATTKYTLQSNEVSTVVP